MEKFNKDRALLVQDFGRRGRWDYTDLSSFWASTNLDVITVLNRGDAFTRGEEGRYTDDWFTYFTRAGFKKALTGDARRLLKELYEELRLVPFDYIAKNKPQEGMKELFKQTYPLEADPNWSIPDYLDFVVYCDDTEPVENLRAYAFGNYPISQVCQKIFGDVGLSHLHSTILKDIGKYKKLDER